MPGDEHGVECTCGCRPLFPTQSRPNRPERDAEPTQREQIAMALLRRRFQNYNLRRLDLPYLWDALSDADVVVEALGLEAAPATPLVLDPCAREIERRTRCLRLRGLFDA